MVFHELGADVRAIGCSPDGLNINRDCGATHPEALVKAVREQGADFGIALDGDADRLQLVDGSGRLYNGDELLYVMVADRLAAGERVPGAVGTLMTNMAVENALRERDVDFVRAKVGDRYVLEELERRKWLLGGEGSGHLLALDKHTTGDGLISALQVLRACVRGQRGIAQLLEGVTLYPQTLVNVKLQPGQDWSKARKLGDAKASLEQRLAGKGRILIRPSGTEPVVRVMVEAQDEQLAREGAKALADAIQAG
jgi:phosphoglucosamine mutase